MRHNNHSRVFKTWFIIAEILFVVIAIALGFIFKTSTVESTSYYGLITEPEEHFNWGLTITFYLSSIPLTAVLYAVYSHLENQEILINIVDEISRKMDTQAQAPNNANDVGTVSSGVTWICSKCGGSNPSNSPMCKSCGAYR